jgi:predicted nucleotidyltransferase component of viral defense system
MLEVRYVDLYASGSGVDRSVAERDILLTYVLKMMKEYGILQHLVFKGGTCIRKMYLGNLGSFSEDLDFTLIGYDIGTFSYYFDQFINQANSYGLTFEAVDVRAVWGRSYACDVGYSHEWNSGSFKLEVSLREDPVLPPMDLTIKDEVYFKYTGFKPFPIPCMALEEVISEKIRAAYQRGTVRDFFDLYQLANWPYDRDLVKRLTVIKFWNSRSDYGPQLFFQKVEETDIEFSEIQYLLKHQTHPGEGEIRNRILYNFRYLTEMEADLETIRKDARRHRREKLVRDIIESLR